MKPLFHSLLALALGGSLAVGQTMPASGLKGYWKFDDAANLGKAEVGNPLIPKHMITAQGDINKFVAIAGPAAGNGAVTVGLGSYFECIPDLPANGADTAKNVNRWTIAMDVRWAVKEWHSLAQMDPTTFSDTLKDALGNPVRVGPRFTGDADIFIRPEGKIGVGSSGYSYDTATVNQWYRVVITADLGAHQYFIYRDGQLLHTGNAGNMNLDNRFSIQSIDGLNKLALIADEDGEDGDIDVAFIALYDRALSPAEVESWGGYGSIVRNQAPVAQWDFESTATPLQATVGADLVLNGSDAALDGPASDNKARTIASGSSYSVTSPIPANGAPSATRSNQYAIKIDFRVNSVVQPHPLVQTDSTSGSGAELYVSVDGEIGNPALGYSPTSIKTGKWHRLVINADLISRYEVWLDGFPMYRNGPQTLNGRYSLAPKGSLKSFLFFADSATYAGGSIDVAGLSLWNRSLDSVEIFNLGEVPVPATDTAAGPGGFAIYGDGSLKNQYGRVAPHADFDFDSTKSFSVEVWTKSLQNWDSDPSILGDKAWTSGGNPGWVISADAGRNRTWKFNLADEYRNRIDINMNNDTLSNLNDGKWHHLAVTVDQVNKLAMAYTDGKFVRATPMTDLHGSLRGRNPNVPSEFYPICFLQDGTQNYPDANAYGGYVDEVRIWRDAVLDSLTIRAWKNKPVTSSHPNYAALVGYWTFEEGKGTSSADLSGHNHPVTLLNGVGFRTSLALTAVEPVDRDVPSSYALENAYPNPFNPSTTIRFALPATATVKLVVFNVLGQQVAQLVDGVMAAGQHEVQWNALTGSRSQIASGVYFYRLDATGSNGSHFIETRKLMLLK
jgi:hypothetical protein